MDMRRGIRTVRPHVQHSVRDRWRKGTETLEGEIRPYQMCGQKHERTIRTGSVWSGREDLNLRPLRPERNALPGCATPRQKNSTTERGGIVLHQRVKTQAMRIGHSPTGNFSGQQVHALRQTGVCPDGFRHA